MVGLLPSVQSAPLPLLPSLTVAPETGFCTFPSLLMLSSLFPSEVCLFPARQPNVPSHFKIPPNKITLTRWTLMPPTAVAEPKLAPDILTPPLKTSAPSLQTLFFPRLAHFPILSLFSLHSAHLPTSHLQSHHRRALSTTTTIPIQRRLVSLFFFEDFYIVGTFFVSFSRAKVLAARDIVFVSSPLGLDSLPCFRPRSPPSRPSPLLWL